MTVHYSERQYFRQDWLWALLLVGSVPAALVGIVAVAVDGPRSTRELAFWSGVVLLLVFGPLVVFYRASLRVSVGEDGLALRLWPLHLRERVVPCGDITAVTVEDIGAWEYGGVGIRLNPTVYRWGIRFDGPVAYVVQGDRGVRIERRERRDLVVTARDPAALADAIERVCR